MSAEKESLKCLIKYHLAAGCQPGTRVMPKLSNCRLILQIVQKVKILQMILNQNVVIFLDLCGKYVKYVTYQLNPKDTVLWTQSVSRESCSFYS